MKKGQKISQYALIWKIVGNVHSCAWCVSSVGFSGTVAEQSTLHLQSNFPFRFVSPGCQTSSPMFWAGFLQTAKYMGLSPWENKCCYGKKKKSISLFPFLCHLLLYYVFRCVKCLHCLCHLVLYVFLCYGFYRSVTF